MPTQQEIQHIVDRQNRVASTMIEAKKRTSTDFYEKHSRLLPPKNDAYKSSQSSSAKIISKN